MNKVLATFLALAAASTVHAQGSANRSKIKASEVVPAEKPQEDIDKEITNARLRASLGSKSKWSIQTSLGINGATIEKPFAEVRPDITSGTSPSSLSDMSASVGVKRSLTARDSISVGTSFSVNNPLTGDLSRSEMEDPRQKGNTIDRFQMKSPYVSYSRAYKVADFQMSTSASYSHVTDPLTIRELKNVGSVSLSQQLLTDFGGTAWTGGLLLSGSMPIYSGEKTEYAVSKGYQQLDYVFGAYPFMEYSFNDRYSLRTVFGYFVNYKTRDSEGDPGAVTADVPYQSVGFGITLNRDIYLYPNIQFTPFDARPERTNVAMSAFINVF